MTHWKPTSALAKAVHLAGFDYDPSQDIIYSRMDALQREFGYAYGYDKNALLMSAAIDCEPIFFEYGGKTWMIELWKGQYGLETGCEIGIYNRNPQDTSIVYRVLDKVLGEREHDSTPNHNLFFNCANDSEMLVMSFELSRDGQKLFTRGPEKHWWLTGFKWGVYSDPDQLTMDVTIAFGNSEMRIAFVNAIQKLGYENVTVVENRVSFTFDTPKTYQPRFSNPLLTTVNHANQQIVKNYNECNFPNNDPNQVQESAFKFLAGSVLQYGTFFEKTLDQAIADLKQWLDVISDLKNFKVMNYSCAVEFDNQSSDITLVRGNYAVDKSTFPPGQDLGRFVIEPAESISPGSRGRLLVQDNFGIHGGEGWVSYDLVHSNGSRQTVKFSFRCPTGAKRLFPNHVKISPQNGNIKFYAKSGDGHWAENNVEKGGHPLEVRFVIS